ncbi:MAG: flagellar basal body rod C-terminal domain-containing protein, partial [Oscillospiraceae bacterium]
ANEDPSRAMFRAQVTDPDTGISTETDAVVITAGNIHVAQAWVDDPTMIGQVRTVDEATGKYIYGFDEHINEDGTVNLQNTNVLYLVKQLNNSEIKFGNANDFQGSFNEYISFISNRLGQKIQYEQSRYDSAVTTVDTLLDTRDDVSGVQLDEEGINMLNYQKWYNASSRIVTALDDLLDKLINSTGRVGL